MTARDKLSLAIIVKKCWNAQILCPQAVHLREGSKKSKRVLIGNLAFPMSGLDVVAKSAVFGTNCLQTWYL